MKKLKPDPEGIQLALKRLNAQDFFFVGDLIHDSRTAEEAGGKSIIVRRKPSKKLELYTDHIVTSLLEIPRIIRSIKLD